ncbi:hypothetical protein Q5P01_004609 [Channa striata]|uniref:Uncharacterized protein n=1 Tax=Channa striata TaxID=64152 RepID=A0AA88NC59_CHASR|nr:hypothetical protein Q5P01_004609 [Channa striata]
MLVLKTAGRRLLALTPTAASRQAWGTATPPGAAQSERECASQRSKVVPQQLHLLVSAPPQRTHMPPRQTELWHRFAAALLEGRKTKQTAPHCSSSSSSSPPPPSRSPPVKAWPSITATKERERRGETLPEAESEREREREREGRRLQTFRAERKRRGGRRGRDRGVSIFAISTMTLEDGN